MSEMANFELEHVVTMECLRMDFIEGKMNVGDAYEHGIVDEHGAMPDNKFAEDNASVPWNHRHEFLEAQLVLTAALSEKRVTVNSNLPKIIRLCEKHRVKWKMLKGMALQANITGRLSVNQCSWLSTNYKGGSDSFILDMQDFEKMVIITNLANMILKISRYGREKNAR